MTKAIKNKKLLLFFFKIILFAGVIYLLCEQISTLDADKLAIIQVDFRYVGLVVLLMFVNWFFEYLKWEVVLRSSRVESPFRIRLRSFLSGILTGFVTPNLLGNFVGRMLYFEPEKRPEIVSLTLLGNASQFISSILFGILSLFWIGIPRLQEVNLIYIWGGASIIFGVIFYLYLMLKKLPAFMKNLSWSVSFSRGLNTSMVTRLKLLVLSSCRYLVFSFQFVLLLHAFGVEIDWSAFGYVWQVYLWSTLLPSLWFGKLLIRESMALWVFSAYTENLEAVLLASVCLWGINQGVTALVGLPFFQFKPERT